MNFWLNLVSGYSDSYLKACLNDCEGKHADTSHSSGSYAKKNSLSSIGFSVQQEVLLQRVEGAEIDAHAWDAAYKRLSEEKKEIIYQ